MNDTMQPGAPEQQGQTWGGPQPPAAGWSMRKTLAAVAVAAGIAVVGGGVIYAASQSNDSQGGFGGPGGGPGMSMGGNQGGNTGMQGQQGMAMTGTPLHGSFVVSDGNGGYTTELTQTGTVTEISSTSVTATSTDNYVHTYTIGGSTAVSGIEVGDTVTIRATESDGTATVSAISEGTGGPAASMNGQGARPGN